MRKKQKDKLTVEERHELETWINELIEARNTWKEMMLHPDLYKS